MAPGPAPSPATADCFCSTLVFRTFRAMVAQSRLVFPGLSASLLSNRGVVLALESLPDRFIRDLAYLRYVSFSG